MNRFASDRDRAASSQSKVTVNLLLRHVALLDRLAIDMRPKRRFRITRSDLIAGIIDAWQRSGVDLSEVCSGQEIAETMREEWSGKRKRRG
jgi:hypothetical protein